MRLPLRPAVLAVCLAAVPAAAVAQAQETAVPAEARQDLALQIYNGGFTVVQDTRRITFTEGENRIAWQDVSRQAQADTALFTQESGPALTLIEQSFDFDLLSPERLLAHSVGREVLVVRTNPATGEETTVTAEVLSVNGGTILRIGDQYHTSAPGRIVFTDLPPDLRTRPTLLARIGAEGAGEADVRLTYHTGGLDWSANYVGTFDEAASRLTLESRVILNNQTGIDYTDAAVRLIAGDVRQVQQAQPRGQVARMRVAEGAAADEVPSGGADFHVFELPRRVTIENNQSKQVAFLPVMRIAVTPEYRFDGDGRYYRGAFDQTLRENAAVWMTFENTEEAGAGRALASGAVRVYREVAGQMTYMGGDGMGNTPVGETVRLQLASAFDITSERVQTEWEVIEPRNRNESRIVTTAYRITIRNAKERDVEVIVTEPIPGDWQMLDESEEHERVSANRVEWRLTVPAGGETELTYRVRYR